VISSPSFTIHDLHFTVVLRHCFQNAIPQDGAQRFGASFQNLFNFRLSRDPRENESSTNVSNPNRMLRLNSDSQPRELICSQRAMIDFKPL
jgi:hypothetical protein